MMPVEVVFSSWQLGNIKSDRLASPETWPQLKEEKVLCSVSGSYVILLGSGMSNIAQIRAGFSLGAHIDNHDRPGALFHVLWIIYSLPSPRCTLRRLEFLLQVLARALSLFSSLWRLVSICGGNERHYFIFTSWPPWFCRMRTRTIECDLFAVVNCDYFISWYHYITESVDQQGLQESRKCLRLLVRAQRQPLPASCSCWPLLNYGRCRPAKYM